LEEADAILPNAIIIAFIRGALLQFDRDSGRGKLIVDVTKGPPGWIVDGQQRFTALSEIGDKPFEVLVSGFICGSQAELKRQFVLVNKTRPLPKDLVNELIPYVPGLPEDMNDTITANRIIELLNYSRDSSLFRLIKTHTNPKGVIRDAAIRSVITSSLTDGALRLWRRSKGVDKKGFQLVSEFFYAVQHVFRDAWEGHKPATSRLVHGAGVVAMGQVMEELVFQGAETRNAFVKGLSPLRGKTAWTRGVWKFGRERRAWDGIENTSAQKALLRDYLVDIVKQSRPRRAVA
jgi:DGQHR domain-containing protein